MRTVGGTVGLSAPDVHARGRRVVWVGDWRVGKGDVGERAGEGSGAQEPEEQAEAEAGGHGGGLSWRRVSEGAMGLGRAGAKSCHAGGHVTPAATQAGGAQEQGSTAPAPAQRYAARGTRKHPRAVPSLAAWRAGYP